MALTMKKISSLILLFSAFWLHGLAQQHHSRFRALVLYDNGGHHVAYSSAAKQWLNKLAADSNFQVDYFQDTKKINDSLLQNYQLFIQLDYPPYGWEPKAAAAFIKYIEEGGGGWIGFHHASLLGEFDGYAMWDWFSGFMGAIRWKDYIATFVQAQVNVEDTRHPVMHGVPASFTVKQEEFYTYDKSPRPGVHVLASVDEKTYQPNSPVKMGDHPVIWSNEHVKARNIYIFMGHSPVLFDDDVYKRIFSNAIFWASGR